VGNSKRPSVLDISWATRSNDALDQAVKSALSAGISVTAAAGDNGVRADQYSPGQGK
jgi:hypothetical protein